MGPAVGLIATAVVGLMFLAVACVGMSIDGAILDEVPDDPAERAGFIGGIACVLGGGAITHIMQILGGIAMLRVRSRMLAQAGTYLSFLPCNCYCFWIGIPFAIWGAIVLANPQVQAAFDQP
jgi:hypothetical protein